MSAKGAAKESEKHPEKVHHTDVKPLKLCAKYNPPMIAVVYVLAQNPSKKYLHEIPIPTQTLQDGSTTSQEIYSAMTKSEPNFLTPKVIPERQVVRLLDKIRTKLAKPASAAISKQESAKKALQSELQKELGAESYGEDQYADSFIEDSGSIPAAVPTKHPAGTKKPEPAPQKKPEMETKKKELQRVFVEDLGEELLMDEQGNLYDEKGNLIGQAESDDDDPVDPEPKTGEPVGEDDKYFEDSPDKQ